MRAAIFSMNAADVEPDVNAIVHTLHAAGWDCVRASYWTSDYTPKGAFADQKVPLVSLAEFGLAGMPRYTMRDFLHADGEALDFADVALHDHAAHGWPVDKERLNLESQYYQRLRGAAVKARHLLKALAPDLAIVQQGAEPVSRLVGIEAARLGIPQLIWESPFFPGFINLDVGAQHFFAGLGRIDREWPKFAARAPKSVEETATSAFLADWSQRRLSKYEQPNDQDELARFQAFADGAAGGLLFLPAQLPWDANVIPGLGSFRTLDALYESTIARIPANWRIVVKVHPKDATGTWRRRPRQDNLLIVEALGIHELITRSDVVLTHSSNVGLEALLLRKPVVTLGTPHYAGRGLTIDAADYGALPPLLEMARTSRPPRDLVVRYLSFLLNNHLIRVGDANGMEARIGEAVAFASSHSSPLTKMARSYGVQGAAYLKLVAQYDELARRNFCDAEIRATIPDLQDRSDTVEQDELNSNERQVPHSFEDVDPSHLARYMFAAAVLAPGKSILDLACGAGYGAHLLAESAADVVGVDGSSQAIAFANEQWGRDGVRFETASAGRWFDECVGTWDVCVSFETVEHVYDAELCLSNLWSRLRDGGTLLISTPNAARYPLTDNPFHVRHFERNELLAQLSALPACGIARVWFQNEKSIGPGVRNGRFLVGLACKGTNPSTLRYPVDTIVPYHADVVPSRDHFKIGAAAFQTNAAEKRGDRIVIRFVPTDCHVVYGPYKRLPPGSYSVEFLLEVEAGAGASAGQLVLEVVNTNDRFYATRRLSGAELHGGTSTLLEFENAQPDSAIEFRIYAQGRPTTGFLSFRGVSVSRR